MKNNRLFLKCAICGNLIGMIEDTNTPLHCCGKEMTQLIPNTTDGAREKHIPVAVRKDSGIEVRVGSVPHPMLKEHHISWIALAGEGWTQRVSLENADQAIAFFKTDDDGKISVYEYCNLHGLWASEL